jgi:hypothetical protein
MKGASAVVHSVLTRLYVSLYLYLCVEEEQTRDDLEAEMQEGESEVQKLQEQLAHLVVMSSSRCVKSVIEGSPPAGRRDEGRIDPRPASAPVYKSADTNEYGET